MLYFPKHFLTPEIDLTPFDPMNTVSRRHARIHLEKSVYSIEDLRSGNKTQLGAAALTRRRPESLKNGGVISFGAVKAVVRLLGTSELPAPWSQP